MQIKLFLLYDYLNLLQTFTPANINITRGKLVAKQQVGFLLMSQVKLEAHVRSKVLKADMNS